MFDGFWIKIVKWLRWNSKNFDFNQRILEIFNAQFENETV